MKERKLANRYARSLFELAIDMNVVETVYQDAELIFKVCKENRKFILLLKSPVVKDSKKLAILKAIFEEKLHDITFKFLVIITRNRREMLIMDIAEQLISTYKKFKNILPARLVTAHEIDAETRKKMIELLHKNTQANIELNEEIDKELIGGFIVTYDDKQYDASIKRLIRNLHKEFDINLYKKGF